MYVSQVKLNLAYQKSEYQLIKVFLLEISIEVTVTIQIEEKYSGSFSR